MVDLWAYVQIIKSEKILKEQNIEVPRLRGLRLMKEEELVSQKKIKKMINADILFVVKRIIREYYIGEGCYIENNNPRKDILMYKNGDTFCPIGYRWNKIHGKKRKKIKYEIKQIKKEYRKQYDLFNSFVGQDVLYVHARIGGDNWNYFEGWKLTKHPDYLGHCDDACDGTYCDLYFKIRKVDEKGD